MLDAAIEAVIIPAADILDHSAPSRISKAPSGRRVQARFLVPSQWTFYDTFEEVYNCFAGVLETKIGAETNRETLICLTDTRSSESFRPCALGSSNPLSCHYLDVGLDIPSSGTLSCVLGASEVSDLPPPTSISGSTYIAQQTALSDRKLVRGNCEVSYRLQAQLCRGQKLIQELSIPVKFPADHQVMLKASPLSNIMGSGIFTTLMANRSA